MTAHITERADRFVRNVFQKSTPAEEQKPPPKAKQDMLQRLRRRRDRLQRARRQI
jgi:hypothetical protein